MHRNGSREANWEATEGFEGTTIARVAGRAATFTPIGPSASHRVASRRAVGQSRRARGKTWGETIKGPWEACTYGAGCAVRRMRQVCRVPNHIRVASARGEAMS